MSDAIVVISKVLPVILLIIFGHILQRTKFLKQGTIDELKKIIVNISLPSLLFLAFSTTKFDVKYLLIFIAVFATCVVMLFAGIGFRKAARMENKFAPTLFAGFEMGMMGYSIFVAVYGSENMFKIAVMDLGQVTFVFFVLVSYLQRLNGQAATAKQLTLSFLKSPVILSILLGILYSVTGAGAIFTAVAPLSAILEAFSLLSKITVPIICIVIGYELRIDLRNLKLPLLAAVTRLVLLMAIAFLLNHFLIDRVLHLDKTFQIALYTMFLLPPPFVIPIYMKDKAGNDKNFILNTISIGILLSLAAYLLLILVV